MGRSSNRQENLIPLRITRPTQTSEGIVTQSSFLLERSGETTIAELKSVLQCSQLSYHGKLLSDDLASLSQCGLSAYSQLIVIRPAAQFGQKLIGGMKSDVDDHFYAVKGTN